MSTQLHSRRNGVSKDAEYWCAFLAATIADILKRPAGVGRGRLRAALELFRQSKACSAELGNVIDGLTDEAYDPGANYRPCGNPECRARIPRSSPRLYCDSLCRKVAGEYADEERRREEPEGYGEIPF